MPRELQETRGLDSIPLPYRKMNMILNYKCLYISSSKNNTTPKGLQISWVPPIEIHEQILQANKWGKRSKRLLT
jgi:hypothetical protein